jgi:hypothetical protein
VSSITRADDDSKENTGGDGAEERPTSVIPDESQNHRDQSAIYSGGRGGMTARIADGVRQEMTAGKKAQLQEQNESERAANCGRPGKRSAAPSGQGKKQGYAGGEWQ